MCLFEVRHFLKPPSISLPLLLYIAAYHEKNEIIFQFGWSAGMYLPNLCTVFGITSKSLSKNIFKAKQVAFNIVHKFVKKKILVRILCICDRLILIYDKKSSWGQIYIFFQVETKLVFLIMPFFLRIRPICDDWIRFFEYEKKIYYSIRYLQPKKLDSIKSVWTAF